MLLGIAVVGGLSVIILVVHHLQMKKLDRHITKMMYGHWKGYYCTSNQHYTTDLDHARDITAEYLAKKRKEKKEEEFLRDRIIKWRKEYEKEV